jgi:hypothetical protein
MLFVRMWSSVQNYLLYNRTYSEQVAYDAKVQALRQGYKYYCDRLSSLESDSPGYSAEKELVLRRLQMISDLQRLPASSCDWSKIEWDTGRWVRLAERVQPGQEKAKRF